MGVFVTSGLYCGNQKADICVESLLWQSKGRYLRRVFVVAINEVDKSSSSRLLSWIECWIVASTLIIIIKDRYIESHSRLKYSDRFKSSDCLTRIVASSDRFKSSDCLTSLRIVASPAYTETMSFEDRLSILQTFIVECMRPRLDMQDLVSNRLPMCRCKMSPVHAQPAPSISVRHVQSAN